MDPIRYGVIGFGLSGSVFHAPLIATCPGAELTAVVVRNPQGEAAVRERYPRARTVAAVADLPAMGVDVAVVATPNPSHAQLADEALQLGMGVVVDKPLATSVADGEQLIATAARLGLPLTCYQNRRWDGDFLTVRRLADSGRLGDVYRFESRFERWRPQLKAGWKETPAPGSGVLFDLGAHIVDQAIQLCGPVVDAYSEVRTLRAGAQVPDDSFVALTHESGAVSHLWASLTAAAPGPRFRVLGSEAAFVKSGIDPQEAALRAGDAPGAADWGTEPEHEWGTLVAGDRSEAVPTEPGDYQAFYRALTDALLARRAGAAAPLPVDPNDSLAALRIIESA